MRPRCASCGRWRPQSPGVAGVLAAATACSLCFRLGVATCGPPNRQLSTSETPGPKRTTPAFGRRRDADRLVPLVAEATSEGHSVLVFCSSRKQCESAAALIADLLPQVGGAVGTAGLWLAGTSRSTSLCLAPVMRDANRMRTAACCHSSNALLFSLQIAPPPVEKQAELAALRQGIIADIKIAMGTWRPAACHTCTAFCLQATSVSCGRLCLGVFNHAGLRAHTLLSCFSFCSAGGAMSAELETCMLQGGCPLLPGWLTTAWHSPCQHLHATEPASRVLADGALHAM